MGIISDNLTRYVADHPELAPTPIDMFHNDEISFVEMCDMLAEQEADDDMVIDTDFGGEEMTADEGLTNLIDAHEALDAMDRARADVVLDPAGWGEPSPSKVELEWLDATIESLEAELAEYSNFAWNTPGRVFRHETLIRLVARRQQIAA